MPVRSRTSAASDTPSTSHVINLAALGAQADDQIILCVTNDAATCTASTSSTGWSQLDTAQQGTSTNHRGTLFTKTATGSDNPTITLSESQELTWVAICVYGVPAAITVLSDNGGSNTSISFTGITGLATGNYISILFACTDSSTTTSQAVTWPAGWTTAGRQVARNPGITSSAATFSSDVEVTGVTGASPGNATLSATEQWITFNVLVGGSSSYTAPDTVFDLSNWHLTLPTGATDATQINQPALATYADPNFNLDGSNMMVCVAPVNGATTSGSTGTRCELRQHEKADYASTAFDPATTGRRELTLTTRADATSITGGSNPRQEVIICQIHGASGTPPLYLTAEWTSGGVTLPSPLIRVFPSGAGLSAAVLLTGITPTTDVSIRVRVESAVVKLWVAIGAVSALPLRTQTPDFTALVSAFTDLSSWYFKAGIYHKTEVGTGASGQATAMISHLSVLDPADAEPTTTKAPPLLGQRRCRMRPLLVR